MYIVYTFKILVWSIKKVFNIKVIVILFQLIIIFFFLKHDNNRKESEFIDKYFFSHN